MLLAVSNGKRRKFASPGIAFVTYSKKAGMEKALEMNEEEYEGRNIYVRDRSLKFQLISWKSKQKVGSYPTSLNG